MAPTAHHAFHVSLLRSTITLAATLALAAPGLAQETRLADGRVLIGKAVTKGQQVEVQTRDGKVIVDAAAIVKTRSAAELRRELAGLAKKSGTSGYAHLHLAVQARDWGLERDMWKHIDRSLANLEQHRSDSGNNPVERRLRDFLAQLEPEMLPRALRQAPTRKRVRALLRLHRAGLSTGKQAAIEELLVREPNADQELRHEARHNGSRRQRIGALAALQRRDLAGNDRFVLRTAIIDRSKEVREQAIAIAQPHVADEHVTYMSGGFAHSHPTVRTRTADALAGLGHPSAIPLLVKAGPHAAAGLAAAGDGSTRGHVAFLRQQAYIRDFDVEVAQAAFIADPKVDVLQSGAVLDVTVAGVQQVRTVVKSYRRALKQLTSRDPGADPRQWSNWLAKLPQAEASRTARR